MKLVREFTIDCIPPKTTSQQKKVGSIGGRARLYKGKKTRETEAMLMDLLSVFATESPLEGPLHVIVDWMYPWRTSDRKRDKKRGFLWCITRPDCSNVIKMFEDCMTRHGFWHDDSQVADLRVRKFYCDKPGIRVRIYELNEEEDDPR